MRLLLLGLLVLAGCRHVPTKECTQACEAKEQRCNDEGHTSIDRRWECSKQSDACLDACPKK